MTVCAINVTFARVEPAENPLVPSAGPAVQYE